MNDRANEIRPECQVRFEESERRFAEILRKLEHIDHKIGSDLVGAVATLKAQFLLVWGILTLLLGGLVVVAFTSFGPG